MNVKIVSKASNVLNKKCKIFQEEKKENVQDQFTLTRDTIKGLARISCAAAIFTTIGDPTTRVVQEEEKKMCTYSLFSSAELRRRRERHIPLSCPNLCSIITHGGKKSFNHRFRNGIEKKER